MKNFRFITFNKNIKKIIFHICLSFLLILSCLYVMHTWYVSVKYTENKAIQMAEVAEAGLSENNIAVLAVSMYENSSVYQELKNSLIKVAALNNDIRFAYVYIQIDGLIYFLADSEPADSEDYSPPGQLYYEAGESEFLPFESKKTVITNPSNDRWGRWVSVLVPVKDSETGNVTAVFGVDYPADSWYDYATERTIESGLISVCAIIIFLGFFILLIRNNQYKTEKIKLKAVSSELKESESLFKSVFNQANIGIAIVHNYHFTDTSGINLPSMNPMFLKILGRSDKELVQIDWPAITYPDDLELDLKYFKEFKSGKIDKYEIDKRFLKPDGSYVWVHMMISPLQLENNHDNNHLCLIEDITDRKNYETRLKYLSERNPLTDILNIRSFEEIYSNDNTKEKRAVIFISIHKFSVINSLIGYHDSQKLIKNAANSLLQISNNNYLLFHISEDKFIFYVLKYGDKNDLSELCKKIIRSLNTDLYRKNVNFSLGVIEIASNSTEDAESILKKASYATESMYEKNRCGFCYYNEEMENKIQRENIIRRALIKTSYNKNDHSIFIMYQPIISLKSNKIVGFEALARYKNNDLGIVPPTEFIQIAESSQLILPLGKKIMRAIFEFSAQLDSEGFYIVMTFNVSAIQLLSDTFIHDLEMLVCDTGVNPENLELELTESAFSSNYDEINDKLEKIRNIGIKITIDDFGTGYSSLARVRELNIDCLKIDKYFINKLAEINFKNTMTSDIISMAHKMGCLVIAEGVETEDQKQYLKDNNCDMMQGYLYSKPVDEKTAIEMLLKDKNT